MIRIPVILFIFCALLTGCSKYPEGPGISLRTRTTRAVNIWKFQTVTDSGGTDISSSYNNWLFSIDENQNLLVQWYLSGVRVDTYGSWAFDADKSHLVLEYTNTILEVEFPKTLKILRLKETNLLIEGDGIEFDLSGTL